MHHRAGRAIKAVLEADVDEEVRNDAAYRLARIHLQKDQPADALHALDRIHGKIPDEIRDDIEFLRANVYLALGRPADAIEVLQAAPGLGEPRGLRELQPRHRAAPGRPRARGGRAARRGRPDRGERSRDARDPRQVELRARLALLRGERSSVRRSSRSTGCASRGRSPTRRSCARDGPTPRRRTSSARSCRGRSSPSASRPMPRCRTRCSRCRTPTASSSVHGRAAVLYGRAVDAFGKELAKVDASIASIEKGEFLEGPRARGDPPGQGLGDPAAQPARRARDLLPDGADGVARLPDRAPELSRPRGHAQEAGRVAGRPRRVRRPDRAAARLLRAAAARDRPPVPQARCADAPAARAAQVARPAPPAHADRAAARLPRDRARSRARRPGSSSSRRRSRGRAGPAHEALRAADRSPEGRADLEPARRTTTGASPTPTRTCASSTPTSSSSRRSTTRSCARARRRRTATSATRSRSPACASGSPARSSGSTRSKTAQGEVLEAVAIRELGARRERLAAYQNQARFAFADSYDRAAKAQAAAPGRDRAMTRWTHTDLAPRTGARRGVRGQSRQPDAREAARGGARRRPR